MQCSCGGGGSVEEEKGREGSVEGEKKEEEREKDGRGSELQLVSNTKEKRYQRGLGIVGKKLEWFCCPLFFVWGQVSKPHTRTFTEYSIH